MSTSEILEELPTLECSERQKVWQMLEELKLTEIVGTPEMLAAIDAAQSSLKEGKSYSIEQAHDLLTQWTSRST